MTNEARIRSACDITKTTSPASQSLPFVQRTPVGEYTDDVAGVGGPTPGYLVATPAGVDVDLSALGTPGWVEIRNYSQVDYITIGIWDGDFSAVFFPMMEIPPGKHQCFKLSRFIGQVIDEAGTGTAAPGESNFLRIKSGGASCKVYVGAYEA
jgi:hypothetical protein